MLELQRDTKALASCVAVAAKRLVPDVPQPCRLQGGPQLPTQYPSSYTAILPNLTRIRMDSSAAADILRRLAAAAKCSSCRRSYLISSSSLRSSGSRSSPVARNVTIRHHGSYSRLRKQSAQPASGPFGIGERVEAPWKPRKDLRPEDKQKAFEEFPLVSASQLKDKDRRPRRMKMLMREFIEDSLYNPAYGYFSKQAVIFNPGAPFPFPSLASEYEFQALLDDRYTQFEDQLDEKEGAPNETRQLWHTPTELFRPHYAEAMARYLVANYKLSLYPFQDLIIYELGAGNGTFMRNVLDYIRDVDPEVYARTRYKIIEISSQLANIQQSRILSEVEAEGHAGKVEIINQSIFQWTLIEPAPCFVVCMEVIDNFGHDAVRYDLVTEEAQQSMVLVDTDGEFYEFWSNKLDPLVARYLRVRDAAVTRPYNHPLRSRRVLRNLRSRLLGGQRVNSNSRDYSQPEYIPTRLLQFFDVLHQCFPAHRLLLSDFHSLPEAVPGVNGPVVQTRFQRRTIAVTTPLVRQGFFDIFFPTDFGVMEEVYRAVTGRLTRVSTQEEFLNRWAYVEDTQTRNGENPLLSWYKNASMLTTV